MFLFTNFQLYGIIGGGVVTTAIGLQLLRRVGRTMSGEPIVIKPKLANKGTIVGGLLFGVGWALIGYCPGTAFGALGEGRYDALWGMLGMLAGAGLFAELYPAMEHNLLAWGYRGPLTVPQLLQVNHWFVVVPFVAGEIAFLRWVERKGL